jgi:hypothetical protein
VDRRNAQQPVAPGERVQFLAGQLGRVIVFDDQDVRNGSSTGAARPPGRR